jgi:hypothetical protein
MFFISCAKIEKGINNHYYPQASEQLEVDIWSHSSRMCVLPTNQFLWGIILHYFARTWYYFYDDYYLVELDQLLKLTLVKNGVTIVIRHPLSR